MIRKAALGLIAFLLLIMGWVNINWMEEPVDISPLVVKKDVTGDRNTLSRQENPGLPETREEISETFRRPLFYPSRRPFEPAPPPVEVQSAEEVMEPLPVVEPVAPTLPALRLAGISLSGSQRRALLGAADGTVVRWYSAGDNIEGWVLSAINKETVTLASGNDNFRLSLYPDSHSGNGLP
jgi:hypothetical protein